MWGVGGGGGVSVYVFLVGWLSAWVWWCLNVTESRWRTLFYNFICWYIPSFNPKKSTNSSNLEDLGHESSSPVVFLPHIFAAQWTTRFFRVCIELSLAKSQVAFPALHAEHQHWGYRQGGLILDTNTVGGRSVVKKVALWTFWRTQRSGGAGNY